ncbi:hypothetical protein CN425_08565 [Bacillus cereus]|uniref:Uncharacterized protein n=1 Tax=Bacillus cereus TaxID=1396 RepID=A0A2A8PYG1_BACCE|nr:hypothetical protein [Bacillus cereus]EJS76354.1 hypothetical protein ICY_02224 [Bacillus cereus BAG2X1-3]PEW02956.1 hypothetical protein CN425_08565 [Bacillus cereus]
MKKVIKSNLSSIVCIGILLIDFNNLSILGYVFLTTSALAFGSILVNVAVTYYCKRKERKYT